MKETPYRPLRRQGKAEIAPPENTLRLVRTEYLKAVLAERDALREENERLKAGGWQPIETAPKDGTRFLALEGMRHFDCWWHFFSLDGVYNWQDEADSEPEPSHWMPLPKGPQS